MTAIAPPTGFKPLRIEEGYIPHNGPFYYRRAEGNLEFGFQSDERHVNPNGVLHGGAILGFLDTILGHAIVHATRRNCATVSLDTQFMAAVPPGQWITGRARVKRVTRTLAFVDGEAAAGDSVLVTATAVFRLFGEIAPPSSPPKAAGGQ
jgi:uncharacterized protein (TIGR00369 family)